MRLCRARIGFWTLYSEQGLERCIRYIFSFRNQIITVNFASRWELQFAKIKIATRFLKDRVDYAKIACLLVYTRRGWFCMWFSITITTMVEHSSMRRIFRDRRWLCACWFVGVAFITLTGSYAVNLFWSAPRQRWCQDNSYPDSNTVNK